MTPPQEDTKGEVQAAVKAIERLHRDFKQTAENQRKQTLDTAVIRNRLKGVGSRIATEGKLTVASLKALRETLSNADAFIQHMDPARVEDMLASLSKQADADRISVKKMLTRIAEKQISLASELDEIKANQTALSEHMAATRTELKVLAQMVSTLHQPKVEPKQTKAEQTKAKKTKAKKTKQPRLRGR